MPLFTTAVPPGFISGGGLLCGTFVKFEIVIFINKTPHQLPLRLSVPSAPHPLSFFLYPSAYASSLCHAMPHNIYLLMRNSSKSFSQLKNKFISWCIFTALQRIVKHLRTNKKNGNLKSGLQNNKITREYFFCKNNVWIFNNNSSSFSKSKNDISNIHTPKAVK